MQCFIRSSPKIPTVPHLVKQPVYQSSTEVAITLPSAQQCESLDSLAGNTVDGVHNALQTRVPLYCVSPEGRSKVQKRES